MTRDDYVIICGDFGGIWDGSNRDKYWLDWLEDKPFTTLFLDGNHENFRILHSLNTKTWNGGKVHIVRNHVLHLMRGYVFKIGGKLWFAMGGASSHDVWDGILDPADPTFEQKYWSLRRSHGAFRIKGVSWWSEELPSAEEYQQAKHNLAEYAWNIDYIVTHCAPTEIIKSINPAYQPDALTDFLQMIKDRAKFSRWFFGHYHEDNNISPYYRSIYRDIVKI